ncbi:uncharacterized protein RHOBADRAFT_53638 [Rhodotorula graminis WP1]|uniref:Proteophosphoglycan ppg4 n=1 Tax=Rhodotorula graminis (strain WP1) TaxID=578459 RepID=A0A194S5I5_RHOGW|nr:uncharacterized protein RHOBADRAFT_53638 [Rhodotorula graminis WP1]KPV74681.1 hypothetical protein RHOBADRAFT_53638 [Rhodotorula graminis WP1]
MAVRRLARQGLQWAEQQPVASTSQLVAAAAARPPSSSCPGCRRGLAHAVQLEADSTTAVDKSTGAQHGTAPVAKSGGRWTSLLFPSSSSSSSPNPSTPTPAPPAQLTGAAADLVQELKRQYPDPNRTWDLFTQLDYDGRILDLHHDALVKILPALYLRAPKHRTVQNVTAAARAYQTKVDLVRLRLRQAGVPVTRGEHSAILRQFHALRYAPGVVRAWDALVASGDRPQPADCTKAFEALVGWTELHGRAAGRAVERAVAKPLALKAAEMLFLDIDGLAASSSAAARRGVDAALEPFFGLVVKAGDHALFARAFKKLYGFDIALPGALFDASTAERAQLRTIGESEVCWILESLADKDDLPGMIAVFETFDQPARPTSDFFTPTSTEGRQPLAPPTSEADAHLIGTRAFTILIQTASRLENAHVARHYFDLLFMRWSGDADLRLREIEDAVGIVEAQDDWVDDAVLTSSEAPHNTVSPLDASPAADCAPASSLDGDVVDVAATNAVDAVDAAAANGSAPAPSFDAASSLPLDTSSLPLNGSSSSTSTASATSTPTSTSSIPHSVSLVSQYGAHLTPAPSAPAKPYVVPSTLIAHVAHRAKTQYDSSTAWWLRRRTKRILQLMESHMARIQGVLEALEVPGVGVGVDGAAEDGSAQAGAGGARAEAQSVAELKRELALVAYHLDQLRLTLSSVKADSRIISAWKVLHARQSSLSVRRQRLADPSLGRRDALKRTPAMRRKERQVLQARMLLVRHRIQKLRDVDGLRTGDAEHDRWVADYRQLKARAFPAEEAAARDGVEQVQAQAQA